MQTNCRTVAAQTNINFIIIVVNIVLGITSMVGKRVNKGLLSSEVFLNAVNLVCPFLHKSVTMTRFSGLEDGESLFVLLHH